MKKTLVMGASPNPSRYSNMAMKQLLDAGHNVYAVGSRPGTIYGLEIHTSPVPFKDLDTVTLYINPLLQKQYYDYLISLKPARIIFNPGTENPELEKLANSAGIHCENACTLVLLSTDQY
jgi:predicted CoA-binding protein